MASKKKVYRRVCTDMKNDDWHTVAVSQFCTVREIVEELILQKVPVEGKSLVYCNDTANIVSFTLLPCPILT